MRAVNLLPRDEQRPRLQGKRLPLLVAVGGIVVATAAAAWLGHSAASSADEQEARLQAVRALSERLPKREDATVAIARLAQERNDRTAALSAAVSGRLAFDRLLRQVALVLPDDAWLTGVRAVAPEVAAPATGSAPTTSAASPEGVVIEGATSSQEAVARVLARLALLPALEAPRLTASAAVEPSDTQVRLARKVVTFTITASLRTGAVQ